MRGAGAKCRYHRPLRFVGLSQACSFLKKNPGMWRCQMVYSWILKKNISVIFQEKDWLRSFYYDVEKGLRQNETDGEFVEVSLRSLHQIKRVICNEMQSSTISSWLPLDRKLMTLDRLQRGRNSVFGGSIFCKESSVECLLGKSMNILGEGNNYIRITKWTRNKFVDLSEWRICITQCIRTMKPDCAIHHSLSCSKGG